MITLEEAEIGGINTRRAHQRAIGKMLGSLAYMYYKQHAIV